MTWEEGAATPSDPKSFTMRHRPAVDRQTAEQDDEPTSSAKMYLQQRLRTQSLRKLSFRALLTTENGPGSAAAGPETRPESAPTKIRIPPTAGEVSPKAAGTKSRTAPTAPETNPAAPETGSTSPETVLPTSNRLFERTGLANSVSMLHLASRDTDGDEEDDPISVASMSIFDTPTSMVSVQLHTVRGTDFARPFDTQISPPCTPRQAPTPSGPVLASDSAFLDGKGGGIFGAFRRHVDEPEPTKKQRQSHGPPDDSSPGAPFRGSPNRAMRKTGGVFSIFTKPQKKEARPDLDRDETETHTSELFPCRNAMRTSEGNAIG